MNVYFVLKIDISVDILCFLSLIRVTAQKNDRRGHAVPHMWWGYGLRPVNILVEKLRLFFHCIFELIVQTWRGLQIWLANFLIVNNLDHCHLYKRPYKYRLNVCSLTFVYQYVERYAGRLRS